MSEEKIKELIEIYPERSFIPCAVAHFIAAYVGCESIQVGRTATEMKVKITQCQLGLFGFGRKGKSAYKITGRKVEVGQDVMEAISSCAAEGKISCAGLWNIAEQYGIMRAEAGNAADGLGIKVSPCQLGAF